MKARGKPSLQEHKGNRKLTSGFFFVTLLENRFRNGLTQKSASTSRCTDD